MPLIIDELTGDVLKRVEDGYTIVVKKLERKKSIGIDFGTFVKINSPTLRQVYEEVNSKLLIFLMSMTNYKDGKFKEKGKELSRRELCKLAKMDIRTFDREMNNLVNADIIHKYKKASTVYYLMNPYVCMRGKQVNVDLVEEFKGTKWSERPHKKKKKERENEGNN